MMKKITTTLVLMMVCLFAIPTCAGVMPDYKVSAASNADVDFTQYTTAELERMLKEARGLYIDNGCSRLYTYETSVAISKITNEIQNREQGFAPKSSYVNYSESPVSKETENAIIQEFLNNPGEYRAVEYILPGFIKEK